MPNWSDPAEIARDADAFNKLMFALFGLYVWELVVTSPFDWSVIARKRTFRWPLGTELSPARPDTSLTRLAVFYFLTRYTLLWALVGLMITINVTTEVNCQALYTFCQWAGNTAIASASTCLMMRTFAIWERRRIVVVPLTLISLGQWGLLYYAIFSVKAQWVPEAAVCLVTGASSQVLNVLYFYTMSFDAVVLVLSVVGLLGSTARSNIWNLLLKDGIIYFVAAFSANTVPAVLNVLNLNPAMNIIAAVPAAAVSTIAATRAVVRLMTSFNKDPIMNFDTSISSQRTRQTLAKYAGGGNISVNASVPVLSRPTQSQLDLETEDIELEHKVRRFPSGSTGHGVHIDIEKAVEYDSPINGHGHGRQPSTRRPPPPMPGYQSGGDAI